MSERILIKLRGGEFDGMQADKSCNCQLRIDCPFDTTLKKVVRVVERDCIECVAIYSKKGVFHKYIVSLSDCEVLLNEKYEVINSERKANGPIKVWEHPFKKISINFREVFR